jgi:pSer/pThr/pTyr-binding forkhead associated (FHA) protein
LSPYIPQPDKNFIEYKVISFTENIAKVITLTLLHPLHVAPAQKWTFEDEPIIRIGRGTDNHVVIYSAVVSRRHVEVRRYGEGWQIFNVGKNGTYVDGESIVQKPINNGVIFRLARSGPQIQINYDP